MHRHRIATLAVVGALGLGGCGDEASESVDDVRTQAEEAVEQGREAVEGSGATDVVRETRDLIDDVGRNAEQLAQDPDADVDQELADAEERARQLADRAERELEGRDEQLGQELGAVNERLADTAADLQEVADPQDVRRIVEEDLSQVSDQLRSAVEGEIPDDVRRQLEQARDRVDELQRELPSPGAG